MSRSFPAPLNKGIAAEIRATTRLALPLITGQLATMLTGVIELALAGHLGAHVLGAVAIGNSVWGMAVITMAGLMMAVSPSVAQLDGAQRRGETAPLFCQALWLAGAVGIAMGVLLYLGGPGLARLSGISDELMPDVAAFLHPASFAAPPIVLYFACRGLSEGLSLPRPTMLLGLFGLIALLPIGYTLMYVLRLGAFGSGIAMTSVCWLLFLGFAFLIARGKRYRGLGWSRRGLRPDFAVIGGLLRIGLPMAISVAMEAALFSTAGLLVGRFGDAVVAGHQVALSVASVTFMMPMGLAMAITVRVGNAVGRGDPVGVRRAGLAGIALTLVTQTLSCTLMLALPAPIASIYSADPAVLSVAVLLLQFAAAFQFSDGIQVASNGALRGLKDARVPMLITAVSYWGVGMPVGWFLAFRHGWQAPGMWMGLIAGLTVAATLLFTRFFVLSRRQVLPDLRRDARDDAQLYGVGDEAPIGRHAES
jgi:MATE family multidrug resistance protein